MQIKTIEASSDEEILACIRSLKRLEDVVAVEEELYLLDREDPELVAECIKRHRNLTWSKHHELS